METESENYVPFQVICHTNSVNSGSPCSSPPSSVCQDGGNNNNSKERRLCEVCGDWGTGKHYGAWTCFGCKGFFQRTVRKGAIYVCRFERNCKMTKMRRNQCRYCRFKRCLESGMRTDAVQDERDKVAGTTVHNHNHQGHQQQMVVTSCSEMAAAVRDPRVGTGSTIGILLQAERHVQQVWERTLPIVNGTNNNNNKDNLTPLDSSSFPQRIFDSFHIDFHYLMEWAKQLPFFTDLEVKDQVALVRAHGAEISMMESIRRSLDAEGYLVMANGGVVRREMAQQGSMSTLLHHRVFEKILNPFQRLRPTPEEFVCLKAIMLFEPDAEGLSRPDKVSEIRYQIQILLENWVGNSNARYTTGGGTGRVSSLLLLLPKLYFIRQDLFQLTKDSKVSNNNGVRIHRLVDLVILGDSEQNGCWTLEDVFLGKVSPLMTGGGRRSPAIHQNHGSPYKPKSMEEEDGTNSSS